MTDKEKELLEALDIKPDWEEFRKGPLFAYNVGSTLDLQATFYAGACRTMGIVMAVLSTPHGPDDMIQKLIYADKMIKQRFEETRAEIAAKEKDRN